MKIMVDTNILISAILFPNSKVFQALVKALNSPCKPYVCDYIIEELHRKFKEKFPDHLIELDEFLSDALKIITVVPTPHTESKDEKYIRDIKDRPILRSAIVSKIDYLLTGDKDFLEAKIDKPIIINVSDFLNM